MAQSDQHNANAKAKANPVERMLCRRNMLMNGNLVKEEEGNAGIAFRVINKSEMGQLLVCKKLIPTSGSKKKKSDAFVCKHTNTLFDEVEMGKEGYGSSVYAIYGKAKNSFLVCNYERV